MVLTFLVGLLFVVVAVPLVPIDLRLRLERDPRFSYRVGVRWLFGLIGTSFDTSAVEAPAGPPVESRAADGGERGGYHVLDMLRAKGFVSGVKALGRRLVKTVEIKRFSLWLRAGLEDPADTGRLSGWLLPLSAALNARFPGRFDVAPEFERETLSFSFVSELRIVPARVVWPILAFGVTPGTWRGLRALRRGRAR